MSSKRKQNNSWGYVTSLEHSAEVSRRLHKRALNSYRPYRWGGVVAGRPECVYDALMGGVFGHAWEKCWQTGDVVLLETFAVLQMRHASDLISLWDALASKQLVIYSLAEMREVHSAHIAQATQCLKPFVHYSQNSMPNYKALYQELTTDDAPLGFMRTPKGGIVPDRKQRRLMSQIKAWDDLGYSVAASTVQLSIKKVKNHLGNPYTESEVLQLLKAEKRIQEMEDKLASGEINLLDVHTRWRKLDQLDSYRGKPFPRLDKRQKKFHQLLKKQEKHGRQQRHV